jgi:hypothetical protein
VDVPKEDGFIITYRDQSVPVREEGAGFDGSFMANYGNFHTIAFIPQPEGKIKAAGGSQDPPVGCERADVNLSDMTTNANCDQYSSQSTCCNFTTV